MHLNHFKLNDCTGVIKEAIRATDENGELLVHSSRDGHVNRRKTKENYDLIGRQDPLEYYKQRFDELHKGKFSEKDTNVITSNIVYLPEEYKGDKDKERKFFTVCSDFFIEHYGYENCLYAIVHKDEKNPHLHFSALPVEHREERKTSTGRVREGGDYLCCKKVDSRLWCTTLHDNLDKYLRQHLDWYRGGLMAEDPNDRAKESLNQKEYQKRKDLEKETAKLDKNRADLQNEVTRQAQINTELKSRSISPIIKEKVENGKRLKKSERCELLALAAKGADSDRILADIDRRRFDNATKEAELNRLQEQINDMTKKQTNIAQTLAKQEQNILNREYILQARSESLSIKEKALSEREQEYNKMAQEVTTLRQHVNRLTNGIKAVCRYIFGIGTEEERRKDYAQAREQAEAFHLIPPMTHHRPKGRDR